MELETITYQDVLDGYVPEGDEFGLAAYALAEPRRKAFLSNPNLTDTSKVMLKIIRENGKIIGRSMMFPSRFKADNQVIDTMGGSALEVAKNYRDGEAGGGLMAYNIRHKENNAIISSGFSAVAAKCHKALRAYMLNFPQMVQIHDFRRVLPLLGVNNTVSCLFGFLVNVLAWPFLRIVKYKACKAKEKFRVEEVDVIPKWVEGISLSDGHKYMEVHDCRWFQWCKDNMFHSDVHNVTRFYTVSKNEENLGFFMIKERAVVLYENESNQMIQGTICEWGTKDSSALSEYDLHLVALSTFSDDVDVVFMATTDENVIRKMKRLMFVKKNEAKIAFYDLKKQYKDAKDISLWRVRFGYGDTILN